MIKKDLKDYIVNQLDELKINDIIIADTSKTSSIADFVIIGNGRSGKHIESSMELLKIKLKNEKSINGIISGEANDGWIILDLGNIIVHLFVPEVRDIYKLEELFNPKKITKNEKVKIKKETSTKTKKTVVEEEKTAVKKPTTKTVSKTIKKKQEN